MICIPKHGSLLAKSRGSMTMSRAMNARLATPLRLARLLFGRLRLARLLFSLPFTSKNQGQRRWYLVSRFISLEK